MSAHKQTWIEAKIFQQDELARQCIIWRNSNQKIVFTNGCFDLLHTGHLDYLAKAASLGNRLIVGLNSDASVKQLKGDERPINMESDRLLALASLLVVDAVCVFEADTPLELIRALQPDVLAKGGDYTPETVVGSTFVRQRGGQVAIIPFVEGYSTTGLIGKIRKL
ncbi:MAG: D-glycero-beta-D-manno-heptose 1-phosphate adenylyltransferase [Sphingobacteriales bacterium]|nr:MAG: D-glycero-beta-D-manno-heptose 1-phosphate adenylyltransferase [Sphingobacteriales bacterium]